MFLSVQFESEPMNCRDLSPKRFSKSQKAKQTLHTEGFVVHRKLIDIPPAVLQDLQERQSRRAGVIFNEVKQNESAKGDGKRLQFRLAPSKAVKPFLVELNRKIAKLSASRQPSSWVVVQSQPGCQEQPAHADYPPMPGLSDEQVPLAVLVALMPGTRLQVWPRSIRLLSDPLLAEKADPIQQETLALEPGDVVLFRGDLVHAGAAYPENDYPGGNMRLHCFFLGEATKHYGNSTWLIDDEEHVPLSIRRAIVHHDPKDKLKLFSN